MTRLSFGFTQPVMVPNIVMSFEANSKKYRITLPVTYEDLENIRSRREAGEPVEDEIKKITQMMEDIASQYIDPDNVEEFNDVKRQISEWISTSTGGDTETKHKE